MRIAIIGRSQLLYETADLLVKSGYIIPLIVTAKEAPEYTKKSTDFEALAKSIGAHYIYTPKINLTQHLQEVKALGHIDLAVSINYTGVISQEVIDLFPLGILNAHAGDLPRYRGNAPLAWAIINKEFQVGLCIHKMIGGELDSGNILAKEYYELNINTKVGDLFRWIEKRIPSLMLKAIRLLKENSSYLGKVQPTDPKKALRCYPRLPEDGKINWAETAENILRLINASSEPFMGAFCHFEQEIMIIWRAELVDDKEIYCGVPGQVTQVNKDNIVVITGQGKLKISDVTYKDIRSTPFTFIKSTRKRLK